MSWVERFAKQILLTAAAGIAVLIIIFVALGAAYIFEQVVL